MRIVRKDIDALNATIELTLEPADYAQEFENQLKKVKNQVQIKGFRKGMTPISMVKKMYGKSVFSDLINDTLQKELFGYLDAEKLNYIGQPLPNAEQNTIVNLDINDLKKEYTFSFDLGLVQDVDVKGVDETDAYTWYDVNIPDYIVDKEVLAIRRQLGSQVKATDSIEENDMLLLKGIELDGDAPKESGYEAEFSILTELIPDEALKKEFLSKKAGDTVDANIYLLEDKPKEHIDKYLLKKSEDTQVGEMFRLTIEEVNRVEPAELNQEFYDRLGREAVTDEASYRKMVYDDIKSYYDGQASNYMNRDIMDALIEKNKIELPETFLKKYLKETNENVTEEQINSEFAGFATNMRWSMIKGELIKRFEIQVSEEEIKNNMVDSVLSFMYKYGQLDPSFIDSTVARLMEDKEQVNKVYEELLAEKLFVAIGLSIKKDITAISYDEFGQKVKELNERLNNLSV
ncbi:MAG: hypothetical protein LC107_09420 [Chitinophagales bacterium]|nr:hypothetical protein [Chitinophagales bacterium]